jgi:ribosomal protein S18 acetylase RimI-like enzyme
MPESAWRSRLTRPDGVTVVAETDGGACGLAGGFGDGPAIVHVVSVWVDPAARGRGIGRAVTAAVLAWARETGAATASLWVADGNSAARRLYEQMGFRSTGRRESLPSDPSVMEEQLARDLDTD